MQEADKVVEVLRHYRHDYLNDIQLIKSYTALGRYKKVEAVIENIIYKAEQESRLSALNVPEVAAMLLTYNWRSPVVPVVIEVQAEGGDWSAAQQNVMAYIGLVTRWLEAHAVSEGDQSLQIIFRELESKELIIDFEGELTMVPFQLIEELPGEKEAEAGISFLYISVKLNA
jgi:stage 0 sporulation protein B (sporulation initiation phosphotransferase)